MLNSEVGEPNIGATASLAANDVPTDTTGIGRRDDGRTRWAPLPLHQPGLKHFPQLRVSQRSSDLIRSVAGSFAAATGCVAHPGGSVSPPDSRTGVRSPQRTVCRIGPLTRWRALPMSAPSANRQQPTYSLNSLDVDHRLPPQAPTGCEDTRPVLGDWLPPTEGNHVHENGGAGPRRWHHRDSPGHTAWSRRLLGHGQPCGGDGADRCGACHRQQINPLSPSDSLQAAPHRP